MHDHLELRPLHVHVETFVVLVGVLVASGDFVRPILEQASIGVPVVDSQRNEAVGLERERVIRRFRSGNESLELAQSEIGALALPFPDEIRPRFIAVPHPVDAGAFPRATFLGF